jgi:hypothetical protein
MTAESRLSWGALVPHLLEVLAPYLEMLANVVTIAGVLFIALALTRIWADSRKGRKTTKKITISLPQELRDERLHYYLYHIRDGKSDERMVSRYKAYRMNKEDDGVYSATIEYVEGLGFEFKCYVDIENLREYKREDLVELLERAKEIRQVGSDNVEANRVWLLLENYEDVQTKEGYLNNYFGPRRPLLSAS